MQDKLGNIDFKEVEITQQIGEYSNIIQYYDYYYWQKKEQFNHFEYIAIKMEMADMDMERLMK